MGDTYTREEPQMLLRRQLGEILLPPGDRSNFVPFDCADRFVLGSHSASSLAERVPAGGLGVVVLRISAPHRLRQGFEWLTIPLRAVVTERRLRAAGLEPCGRFAVYPSLDNPTFVYGIGTPAAIYAETHLLPPSSMPATPWLDDAKRHWPSPRIGAILIPARKNAA